MSQAERGPLLWESQEKKNKGRESATKRAERGEEIAAERKQALMEEQELGRDGLC